MKNGLLVALLIGLLLASGSSFAQNTPRFMAQKTVIYPVKNPADLKATIAWYSAFFGQEPTKISTAEANPYAVYQVDGIEVRLETDPKFLQLKETVFYWVLPTPDDVENKFNTLNANPANRFEGVLFRRMQKIEEHAPARGTEGAVAEVREFVVLDPSGNPVGVINNPIYPPAKPADDDK
ncbi:hypothetical protein SAMN02745146_3642 [Hymenobacter daecheongensis DSM 21074]|uniref:VOC domain-containing protein n=1 Tax=Hymenobacter daecheongensis DSM 21074 TaxID=1121955 RepID=A0A1M6L6T6_9BACT|nr:hypothetical protein [Hymenobacter daecheongensis]SHJ66769.1 hypothetical protein SAMN02745146_3642 [Hymenobacter daecheongensis DSM 21074]